MHVNGIWGTRSRLWISLRISRGISWQDFSPSQAFLFLLL